MTSSKCIISTSHLTFLICFSDYINEVRFVTLRYVLLYFLVRSEPSLIQQLQIRRTEHMKEFTIPHEHDSGQAWPRASSSCLGSVLQDAPTQRRTKTSSTLGVGEPCLHRHASCGYDRGGGASSTASSPGDACGPCHATSASDSPTGIRLLRGPAPALGHSSVAHHAHLGRSAMDHHDLSCSASTMACLSVLGGDRARNEKACREISVALGAMGLQRDMVVA